MRAVAPDCTPSPIKHHVHSAFSLGWGAGCRLAATSPTERMLMLARLRGLVPSCPQGVCKRPSNDAAVQARGQFTYSGLTTASSISRDQRKFSILAFSAFCCWRRSSLQMSRIDRRVSQPRGEHCDLQRRTQGRVMGGRCGVQEWLTSRWCSRSTRRRGSRPRPPPSWACEGWASIRAYCAALTAKEGFAYGLSPLTSMAGRSSS